MDHFQSRGHRSADCQLPKNFKSASKPRGKVKYMGPNLDEDDEAEHHHQQATDRKGGGMSGKLKKKLLKERRQRKRESYNQSGDDGGDFADDDNIVKNVVNNVDDGGNAREHEDEHIAAVDVSSLSVTPSSYTPSTLPQPKPAKQQKNTISTLLLQLSELPNMNSKPALKARAKLQSAPSSKHFFTTSDCKIMDRWLGIIPRCKLRLEDSDDDAVSPLDKWSLVSVLFQSGPYSGSKVFEINRLHNAVLKWKSANGKKSCIYMDRVIEASLEFAVWTLTSQVFGVGLSGNQRRTLEGFRDRLEKRLRAERERGEEIAKKEDVVEEDACSNCSSSSSSDCDFY